MEKPEEQKPAKTIRGQKEQTSEFQQSAHPLKMNAYVADLDCKLFCV